MNETKKDSGIGIASLVMMIIAILANIGAFSVPLVMNEQWGTLYEQMAVDLQGLPGIVIACASPINVVAALCVVVLALIIKEIFLKNKFAALIFNISGFMLATIIFVVYWMAVITPMMVMISGITDQAPPQ